MDVVHHSNNQPNTRMSVLTQASYGSYGHFVVVVNVFTYFHSTIQGSLLFPYPQKIAVCSQIPRLYIIFNPNMIECIDTFQKTESTET